MGAPPGRASSLPFLTETSDTQAMDFDLTTP